jgi:hypothetical protein
MIGIVSGFSRVTYLALAFPLATFALGLLFRDVRRRRPGRALPVVAGLAAAVTWLLLPGALLATGIAAARGGVSRRGVLARLALCLAPSLTWAGWNLWAYGNVWPVDQAGTGPRPSDWSYLWRLPDLVQGVNSVLFAGRGGTTGFFAPMLVGPVSADPRPVALLALAAALGLAAALLLDRLEDVRVGLALLGGALVGTFASILLVVALWEAVAGAIVSYDAVVFAPYGAAWAATAALAITAPFAGRPRLRSGVAVAVSLLLLFWTLQTQSSLV